MHSWGKKDVEIKQSRFFTGENLDKTLNHSACGKIKHTLKKMFTLEEIKQFKLPQIIVVGSESAGKSSLLENITKCPLFPRDSKQCTKCPIHVCMAKSEEPKYCVELIHDGKKIEQKFEKKELIHDFIKKYFESLPVGYISEEVITVTIEDLKMPNFEIYDLPGIRSYPPELADKTIKLCHKYLTNKNSVVLCVVPATVTRLTSLQSIALIQEAKVENNTILALTMSDRLQTKNIEDLLVKRIVGISDEFKNVKFAGCVAVNNKEHDDPRSLKEFDKLDEEWFDSCILKNIPSNYKKYEQTLAENVRIDNLINKINELYEQYFKNDWLPKVLRGIELKINTYEAEYKLLGSTEISDAEIKKCMVDAFQSMAIYHYSQNAQTCSQDLLNKLEQTDKADLSTTVDKFEQFYEKRKFCTEKMHSLEEQIIKLNQSELIKNIFKKYNLHRFTDAQKCINDELCLRACKFIDDTQDLIENKINNCLLDHYNTGLRTNCWYANEIYSYYKLLVLYPIFNNHVKIKNNLCGEDDDYKIIRANKMQQINDAKKHLKKMNDVNDSIILKS